MGDSISEGTVASVEKKEGQVVQSDEVIAIIETDKVTIDVRYTGSKPAVLTSIKLSPEDTVTVGQVVATVDDDEGKVSEAGGASAPADGEGASESKPAEAKPKETAAKAPQAAPKPKPTPEAKQEKAPPPPPKSPPKQPAGEAQAGPSSAGPQARGERRVKMTRLRQRISERLKGAQNTYAMLSTFNEVDMTNLMQMRQEYKDAFLERHGVKLGFMSAFIKAASSALQEIPAVNAVIDDNEIIYRDYTDISIAVATPKGLVVPVLKDVDQLSFAGVEKAIVALGKKAKDGTLSIDEMSGGTFTISNGGVYGSLLSTPIINPPQSAILGMHSIQQRPMVVGKDIAARPMMYIALTYDHRLIDGREAVTFLRRIKDVVEDPRRLLLDI